MANRPRAAFFKYIEIMQHQRHIEELKASVNKLEESKKSATEELEFYRSNMTPEELATYNELIGGWGEVEL